MTLNAVTILSSVKFDQVLAATLILSSEMLRDPGSWQIITSGDGIGFVHSNSLLVLKVSLEL